MPPDNSCVNPCPKTVWMNFEFRVTFLFMFHFGTEISNNLFICLVKLVKISLLLRVPKWYIRIKLRKKQAEQAFEAKISFGDFYGPSNKDCVHHWSCY